MVTPTTTPAITGANGSTLPMEYDPARLYDAYPPNEEPMADIARLLYHFLDMMWPLIELFRKRPDVFVNGNVFIYYLDGDDVKAIAPDLMVSFDVDEERIMESGSYHIWAVGKPPELVMEIGSKSTYNRDLTEKRDIYAKLGIPQYWLFDPPNGSNYNFILKGLRLVNGEYVEIPMIEGPGDAIRGHSEVLGLDLCWENGTLRFYDPAAGEYLKNQEDTIVAREEAEAALADAQAEARRLRAQLADRNQA